MELCSSPLFLGVGKLVHENVELFLLSWVFCKSVSLAGFEIDKT